jgi:menaquinone-specific isochorismate synthase
MFGQYDNAITSGTKLVSYSVKSPQISLSNFLRHAVGSPRIYWDSSATSVCFAGSGITAALTASGPDRFQAIQRQANQLFKQMIVLGQTPPVGPRLFGGFAFTPYTAAASDFWAAFPEAMFILPRCQLTYLNHTPWLTLNRPVDATDDPVRVFDQVQYEAAELGATLQEIRERRWLRSPVGPQITDVTGQAAWEKLVASARQRIKRGDLDKVVLARARQIHSTQSIDPVTALDRLRESYPGCYRFLFEPAPGHAFLGATPELLVEVTGARIRTVALAGSTRRGCSQKEDAYLGQQLLGNPKELHEHRLVVHAIREVLEPLTSGLYVQPLPGLCQLSNIQHLQTMIQGWLAESSGILSVVEALHPTPAVGGRPRDVAMDIIAGTTPRGWYAAPVGWLDREGNGLFAVAIRSAVIAGSDSLLFAGAGIVGDSVPLNEWNETELKFKPLFEALTS